MPYDNTAKEGAAKADGMAKNNAQWKTE